MAQRKTFFEIETLEFIRSRKLTGVYVDAGANTGNHTLYFANECTPALVLSIDGSSATTPILCDNVRRNRRRSTPIWLLQSFISTRELVYFNRSLDDNIGSSFVSEVPIAETSEPAKALRLDDVCLEFPRIQLLKIDVEDHEVEVLQSARKTIAHHQPELCIEAFHESFPAVNDLLASWGYVFAKKLSNSNWYFVPVGPRASQARAKFQLLPTFIRSRLRSHLLACACAWRRLSWNRQPVAIPRVPPMGMREL